MEYEHAIKFFPPEITDSELELATGPDQEDVERLQRQGSLTRVRLRSVFGFLLPVILTMTIFALTLYLIFEVLGV